MILLSLCPKSTFKGLAARPARYLRTPKGGDGESGKLLVQSRNREPRSVEKIDPFTRARGLRTIYGQLRSREKRPNARMRRHVKHLDFPLPWLRTRGSGVQVSPGAPLFLLNSNALCDLVSYFGFRIIRTIGGL
jgi:hypothetical protein